MQFKSNIAPIAGATTSSPCSKRRVVVDRLGAARFKCVATRPGTYHAAPFCHGHALMEDA